jgi:hypothetical protein
MPPTVTIKASPPLPVNGCPDDRVRFLAELLDEGRRLYRLGRPVAEIRRAVLTLNANLGKLAVPAFSPGGLCESLDAVLVAEAKGGAA